MAPVEMDQDGQPLNRRYNAARLSERAVDELIGLCRGVLGDGAITESEVELLIQWMDNNRAVARLWPANQLYRRLNEMLVDDVLDLEEQGELLDILLSLTGGDMAIDQLAASFSATLPLSQPTPRIEFEGRRFCLTGKFAFGSRRQCEAEISKRAGIPQSDPTRDTNYLVIGTMGSTDWIHSTYGRKIEAAVAIRDRGLPIGIVAEQHWVSALVAE